MASGRATARQWAISPRLPRPCPAAAGRPPEAGYLTTQSLCTGTLPAWQTSISSAMPCRPCLPCPRRTCSPRDTRPTSTPASQKSSSSPSLRGLGLLTALHTGMYKPLVDSSFRGCSTDAPVTAGNLDAALVNASMYGATVAHAHSFLTIRNTLRKYCSTACDFCLPPIRA
ncbi:hypothetical protein CALVIDRAFT_193038 [Calocera viscosa TUFC12733]|uniref:Uncharacterized protein n=1 Tax=Calocera viscosa (strain TUFC12733) TaxID=1330018 RepID=A0A167KQP2_CALVF|nr:hypothetical protein CALVIDRAFT_193038 [Calocera viscosa TUFC12733]